MPGPGGIVRIPQPSREALAQIWQPPTGWIPVGPGVWQPSDYRATRWELPQPRVHNFDEAQREWIKCKKSLAYFAFRYVWTLDVDDPAGVSVRKFPAYPYLRRFFDAVQNPENTHSEKSRQLLLTWAYMVTFLWDVLFHKHWPDLVMSKRSTDVDDGGANSTPNSNLGKIRFMAERLPEHLWTPFEFKKFIVRVPANDSYIRGETGKGGKASRGPTYKRALMDEAAYIEQSETAFSGLRQAAKRGTYLNSTPYGRGNTFARIRFSPTTTFRKLSFHWSEHPRKAIGLYCVCGWKASAGLGLSPRDQYLEHATRCPRLDMNPPRSPEMRSPWYDREVSDMTPDKVASELDISYEGSQAGRVYTHFDQTRNVWQCYHIIGPRGVDESLDDYRMRYLRSSILPNVQLFTTIDVGVGDQCALLFGMILDEYNPRVRFIDEFIKDGESYDTFTNVINTVWIPAALQAGNPIAFRHYGGYDTKNRDSKLESWFVNMRREGVLIESRPTMAKTEGGLLEWVDYINDQYRHGFLEISEWCAGLIDAVQNYHFPTDDTGRPLPGTHLPVHDEWSNACDAKRYLYRNRYHSRLRNRRGVGVPAKRILRRGSSYDTRTETRKF